MRLKATGHKRQGQGMAALVHANLRGAAHYATDAAIKDAKVVSRQKLGSVNLGKLANALDVTSSLKKRSTANDNAWGAIFVRGVRPGQTNRGQEALIAYSQGATIVPIKGNWLAYPTKAIPLRAMGRKMTWKGYIAAGFEDSIGKLHFVRISANKAMLIVKEVDVSNRTGIAKARGKRRVATRTQKKFIVAFWLIRVTRRAQRYDQDAIVIQAGTKIPTYVAQYQSTN